MDRTVDEPPEHYFTPQPTSPSEESEFSVGLAGRRFTFRTDAGVFAHRFLDRGTRLLLASLPLPLRGEVLDWGAGYGAIGVVVAALSPEARVVMVEVNERAAALAQANAELNHVGNVELIAGDALRVLGERCFDAILTNPPIHAGKATVTALIEDARRRLRDTGEFWMVVRTQDGAKSYFRLLQELFPRVERVDMRGGYRVFRARVGWGDMGPTDPV
jgi:16S rRNA (guanine1207-N2)-methyltransferase